MRERAGRPREIDEHVGGAHGGVDGVPDDDAGDTSETRAGIVARRRRAGHIEGGGQCEIGSAERGFDQRQPHPPAGTGDGNSRRRHLRKMSSSQAKKPLSLADGSGGSALAAASRFSAAIDAGISSPSQRASLSSTK